MKRLRSSDDLASYGEKGVGKDWGRREDSGLHRSSSHRSIYYKSESGRKGMSSSSSRYDWVEDDRESSRSVRKRPDYDVDGYERRKSYDRYRDPNDRVVTSSSPRGGYGVDRIHRSESFSVPRRDFPKGFRSERDRSRREGSVSSWRRFSGGKDGDEGTRSGSESVKGSRMESDDVSKVKSPQGLRNVKSPPWSKDSGSEHSKSVECKKSEDLSVENGTHSSEMEEGELEPDPHPVPATEPISQEQASVELKSPEKELNDEYQTGSKLSEDGGNLLSAEKVEHKEEQAEGKHKEEKGEGKHKEEQATGELKEEQAGGGLPENVQEVAKEVNELPDNWNPSTQGSGSSKRGIETTAADGDGKYDEYARENNNCHERANNAYTEKASASKTETRGDKSLDLEDKTDGICLPILDNGIMGESRAPVAVSSPETEEITQNFKDKGKGVVVSPSNGLVSIEDGFTVKTEQREVTGYRDADMEGPSSRGLELFTTDPVKKPEKAEQMSENKSIDEKLALELSLSLPNVLLPIGSSGIMQAPGSPSRAKSSNSFLSSFRTNSDGFTTSFSGSQNFTHNPSCSLTHNSFDNCEQSVGSRPIFQGVDWQGLSSNEHKTKEGSVYQNMFSNVNGLHQQSQVSYGNSRGHRVVQQRKVIEGSPRMPVGMERQLSYSKQVSGVQSWHTNDVRSPSQSVGSHETRSEYKAKKGLIRENSGGTLIRINSSDGKEQLSTVGADFAESIITGIVSEPLNLMVQRFSEMTKHQVAYVKESTRDIILNPGKQWQLSALQKALRNRADITLEMLLKSHRTQLEILVALKTGLQEFLQQNYEISSLDLAEIFLNIKCRNLACRNLLPVDECDCKICIQKNGFCSACMCLVCSKFDMASNTCSWVGCDVCLHWCHADCGLQKSYIRNGYSATGTEGTTEMQFHCVACNHLSEMFGFVKEVFQNFANEWAAETLLKELEYVRRIFSASQDVRGKRLHEIAIQMQSKLENKADLLEVQNQIMGFLTDAQYFRSSNTPIDCREEVSTRYHDGSNGIAGSSQGAEWLKSISSQKAPSQADKSPGLFPAFDFNQNEKRSMKSDKQISVQKEPVFDELESIMKIKHAEAKMFQTRADDAQREAEALKCIALSKNEKIDEEYTSRIAKLHLTEAEELRRQKLEELQTVERAYQEYFNMKIRMESDIKDLLLKMEATRRNLAM